MLISQSIVGITTTRVLHRRISYPLRQDQWVGASRTPPLFC